MSKPHFTQTSGAISMHCKVDAKIEAPPEIVWALLTDAKKFPQWNSTVKGIDGEIREGARLRLYVPGTTRTFTPRVSDLVPKSRMIWSDGIAPIFKGVRTFKLQVRTGGSTDFTMEEHFSGIVFALVKRMLPDFRPIFEAYASDLKRESESQASLLA